MEYHLLLPCEVASLLGTSKDRIERLIRSGQLGAFRDDGQWWIPLQCLLGHVGDDLETEPARALARLVQRADGLHSIAEHPEAVARIEQADFPPGTVGVCLQQALRMYRRAEARRTADPGPGEKQAAQG